MSSNTVRRGDRGLGKTASGGNAGSFAPHEREASVAPPVSGADQADAFHGRRRPEWGVNAQPYSDENPVDWPGVELGLDGVGVTLVTATGDPARGEGRLDALVYENPVAAGNLTQAQMDRGWQHVEHTLRAEYGADIVDDGSDEHIALEFSTPLYSEPTISEGMASDLIWERTELVRFRNESDQGTFGSPYVYGRIAREIDEGYFPGATADGEWDHARLAEVKALAQSMVKTREGDDLPQVGMLAERGYCTDADALLTEVRLVVPDSADTAETRQLKSELNEELAKQDAEHRKH